MCYVYEGFNDFVDLDRSLARSSVMSQTSAGRGLSPFSHFCIVVRDLCQRGRPKRTFVWNSYSKRAEHFSNTPKLLQTYKLIRNKESSVDMKIRLSDCKSVS